MEIDGPSIFGIPLEVGPETVAGWTVDKLDRLRKEARIRRTRMARGETYYGEPLELAFKGRPLRRLALDLGTFFYIRTNEHADYEVIQQMIAWCAWAWRRRQRAVNAADAVFMIDAGIPYEEAP